MKVLTRIIRFTSFILAMLLHFIFLGTNEFFDEMNVTQMIYWSFIRISVIALITWIIFTAINLVPVLFGTPAKIIIKDFPKTAIFPLAGSVSGFVIFILWH